MPTSSKRSKQHKVDRIRSYVIHVENRDIYLGLVRIEIMLLDVPIIFRGIIIPRNQQIQMTKDTTIAGPIGTARKYRRPAFKLGGIPQEGERTRQTTIPSNLTLLETYPAIRTTRSKSRLDLTIGTVKDKPPEEEIIVRTIQSSVAGNEPKVQLNSGQTAKKPVVRTKTEEQDKKPVKKDDEIPNNGNVSEWKDQVLEVTTECREMPHHITSIEIPNIEAKKEVEDESEKEVDEEAVEESEEEYESDDEETQEQLFCNARYITQEKAQEIEEELKEENFVSNEYYYQYEEIEKGKFHTRKLDEEQHRKFDDFMEQYQDLFTWDPNDFGRISVVTHKINTGEATP
ncbi:hypothetical protein RhiirA1_447379, partial [Rhizophagus irregularis]